MKTQADPGDKATIYSVLNYQYGEKVGEIISRARKICVTRYKSRLPRQVYLDGKIFGTFNPRTGFITLSEYGAKLVFEKLHGKKSKKIIVDKEEFLKHARNTVLAPIVRDVSSDIRAGDEVFIVDEDDELLATGKALLSSIEIKRLRRGEVARLRKKIHGVSGE